MSQRQWTQLLIVSLLLLFIARSSAADEAVLLVKSQEILSVASKLEESALVGTTVWVGDNRGARGTATVIPKSGHPHDALLDQDFGIELGLAYSGEARFVPIGATKIAPDAVSILVSKKARELGAGDVQELELAELARVDLDGDNEPELLISAHTKRQPSDPYSGQDGDIESIFVVAHPNGAPKVLDQVVKILRADEVKSGRPHIDVIALAQSPATKRWAILMSQNLQRWEDETTTVDVTIGGKTTQQVITERRLTKTTLAAVYILEEGKLTPVPGLRYRLHSF